MSPDGTVQSILVLNWQGTQMSASQSAQTTVHSGTVDPAHLFLAVWPI